MEIRLSKNKVISNDCCPYIIAEIGSNHNGNMDLCKKIIKAAKDTGADCVKFQFFTTTSMFSKKTYNENYFIADDYRNRTDYTLKEIVEAYSIKKNELIEMKKFCEELNIDFAVTPFSNEEADFVIDELNVDFVKIASMDCNNYQFLEYVAKKNKPIVLSTGLCTLDEIDKAVQTIESTGNTKLIILHCVAMYPPPDEIINLKNISTLKKIYPYPIGFSDHSDGPYVSLAATAIGACLIEKHFTIDKNMKGWDHHMSMNENQMRELILGSKKIYKSLGTERIYREEDQNRVDSFRRSIVAKIQILKDEIITSDMLDVKRPGTGLAPEMLDLVVGKKAKRDIDYDEIIQLEDF
jgi:sialic acid synthase SpsE